MKADPIERCYARATLYRLLSLAFSRPTTDGFTAMASGAEAARVAAAVLGAGLEDETRRFVAALGRTTPDTLAEEWRDLFTYSTSPDCPLNECMYSAKHIYQEVQQLADLAGFYRAFGLEMDGQRPDELSAELEFGYLLSLKQAHARERRQSQQVAICKDAQKAFVRDHLGRWAENIGLRLQLLAPRGAYAAFGRLLAAFAAFEIEETRAGRVVPHQEVPRPPDLPEDDACGADAGEPAFRLDTDDVVADLMPVPVSNRARGG